MEKPAFIFDGRNILNHQELYNIGFNVFLLVQPPINILKSFPDHIGVNNPTPEIGFLQCLTQIAL
jgi:hypothetical protein